MDDGDSFKRTLQSRQEERDAIERLIEQFLASGGEIMQIPVGVGKGSPATKALTIKPARSVKKKCERVNRKPKTKTARAATLTEIPTFVTLYPRKHKQGVNP